MSGSDGRWAALHSQNERVAGHDELATGAAGRHGTADRSQWAELASQDERLVNASDPLFRLASPHHGIPGPGHGMAGLRLVSGVA